jgi:hypothetical protein
VFAGGLLMCLGIVSAIFAWAGYRLRSRWDDFDPGPPNGFAEAFQMGPDARGHEVGALLGRSRRGVRNRRGAPPGGREDRQPVR